MFSCHQSNHCQQCLEQRFQNTEKRCCSIGKIFQVSFFLSIRNIVQHCNQFSYTKSLLASVREKINKQKNPQNNQNCHRSSQKLFKAQFSLISQQWLSTRQFYINLTLLKSSYKSDANKSMNNMLLFVTHFNSLFCTSWIHCAQFIKRKLSTFQLNQCPVQFRLFLYNPDLANATLSWHYSMHLQGPETQISSQQQVIVHYFNMGGPPLSAKCIEHIITTKQAIRTVLTGILSLRSPRRGEDKEYESAKPRNTKPTYPAGSLNYVKEKTQQNNTSHTSYIN